MKEFTPKIRALVIDAVEPDRKALARLLSTFDEVEVVAELDSLEAVQPWIDNGGVDVLFLDVYVGRVSGFDFVQKLEGRFKIVFVTGIQQHAVRAFDVRASDYLLKPVPANRLALTIRRLTEHHRDGHSRKLDYSAMIPLKTEGHVSIIRVDAIKYVLMDGERSQVFLVSGDSMSVQKLQEDWHRQLPDRQFLRVNPSTFINLNCIDRVEFNAGSGSRIYLKGVREPIDSGLEYAAHSRDFNT